MIRCRFHIPRREDLSAAIWILIGLAALPASSATPSGLAGNDRRATGGTVAARGRSQGDDHLGGNGHSALDHDLLRLPRRLCRSVPAGLYTVRVTVSSVRRADLGTGAEA